MSDAGRHLGDLPEDTDSPRGIGTENTDDTVVTRHEERAVVSTEQVETGRVRVSKHVESYPVEQVVPRNVEEIDAGERVPALEGDSGEIETLPDGSVSIPVFEEVLVVTKRLVVRERLIVRKTTVVDDYTLRTELRREHVSVEADGDVDLDDQRRAAKTPDGEV